MAVAGIFLHLLLRVVLKSSGFAPDLPLYVVVIGGGAPLIFDLAVKASRKEFGSDLLAAISIVVSAAIGEYLAGALVVLMLSGGATLEAYAVGRASSVLRALAARFPSIAHRRLNGSLADIAVGAIAVGDELVVFPHEICPVDGEVIHGHGAMDESYLTGEPFVISKAPGSRVLSGAINGDSALTIRATQLPRESRYAQIVRVVEESERNRPHLRRLGDQLGAMYSPAAVAVALLAWAASGDSRIFLAVLVIATPCPLLIAIPVAIIGAVSLAAKRGIVIKNPLGLEQLDLCRTVILDKTGTLTYGRPVLTEELYAESFGREDVLPAVAALEHHSRHPLAEPIIKAAADARYRLPEVDEVRERPGQGLQGIVAGRTIDVTSRKKLAAHANIAEAVLPASAGGLECVVLVDGRYAATYRFHDRPRDESRSFVLHLGPRHHVTRVLLVSGDRESEVRYLADQVAISQIFPGASPEDKVAIVRQEMTRAKTVFLGDGLNDAPALTAATVGIAFGANSDITSEAADAVIIDSSLQKVDELFHISRRLRSVALQSAIGGMALSAVGMAVAAAGYLPPVSGALAQEVIDLLAVFNALRVALSPRTLTDF
jgi:heavy metal translocating P-type ATPase